MDTCGEPYGVKYFTIEDSQGQHDSSFRVMIFSVFASGQLPRPDVASKGRSRPNWARQPGPGSSERPQQQRYE